MFGKDDKKLADTLENLSLAKKLENPTPTHAFKFYNQTLAIRKKYLETHYDKLNASNIYFHLGKLHLEDD